MKFDRYDRVGGLIEGFAAFAVAGSYVFVPRYVAIVGSWLVLPGFGGPTGESVTADMWLVLTYCGLAGPAMGFLLYRGWQRAWYPLWAASAFMGGGWGLLSTSLRLSRTAGGEWWSSAFLNVGSAFFLTGFVVIASVAARWSFPTQRHPKVVEDAIR